MAHIACAQPRACLHNVSDVHKTTLADLQMFPNLPAVIRQHTRESQACHSWCCLLQACNLSQIGCMWQECKSLAPAYSSSVAVHVITACCTCAPCQGHSLKITIPAVEQNGVVTNCCSKKDRIHLQGQIYFHKVHYRAKHFIGCCATTCCAGQ